MICVGRITPDDPAMRILHITAPSSFPLTGTHLQQENLCPKLFFVFEILRIRYELLSFVPSFSRVKTKSNRKHRHMPYKAHMNFHNASGQFVDVRVAQSDIYHEYVILTVDENTSDRFASILFSRNDFLQLVERLSEV